MKLTIILYQIYCSGVKILIFDRLIETHYDESKLMIQSMTRWRLFFVKCFANNNKESFLNDIKIHYILNTNK